MSATKRIHAARAAGCARAEIFCHAGISIFSGGFVRIDFVISGFLISSIVITYIDERSISRIFPALFSVMSFCVIASLILLASKYLADLGNKHAGDDDLQPQKLFHWNFDGDGYFGDTPDVPALLRAASLWSRAAL
jgi:peptidoglycan/LPS O-acetylase OafA/YrhL